MVTAPIFSKMSGFVRTFPFFPTSKIGGIGHSNFKTLFVTELTGVKNLAPVLILVYPIYRVNGVDGDSVLICEFRK